MKLNKNIIVAAVAGITILSPVISQSSVVLADVASANQVEQTNTNNQNTTTTTQTPVNNASTTDKTEAPVAEPISQPVQENDPEPKTNMRKTNKNWTKRHKKANNYYNKNVKAGQKLKTKTEKLALYKKTLKHFKNYKTSYAKGFKKYLTAEINWLNKQIKKESQQTNKPTNTDVPTTKPSGDLKPQPVNPPKKEKTKHHEGWSDTLMYDGYLNDYKYFKKHPKVNTPLIEKDIKILKKRGYKFNKDLSDKGYEAHNKELAKRDEKWLDEGKLK